MIDGLDLIDKDDEIRELSEKIENLFSAHSILCLSFDIDGDYHRIYIGLSQEAYGALAIFLE